MLEVWKDIIGYEGIYRISNLGNVYSIARGGSGGTRTGRLLIPKIDRDGYLFTNLQYKGSHKYMKIHRLVAMYFLENPDNKPQVNHIDFIRANNIVTNLEWCTISENLKHTWNHHRRGYNPLHKPGLDNPNTVYGITKIKEMISMRYSGMTYTKIAEIFGCSHSTVQRLTIQHRQIISAV